MVRTYLVVIDDSAEARVALRFAARRASKSDGAVEVLAIVQPPDFEQHTELYEPPYLFAPDGSLWATTWPD